MRKTKQAKVTLYRRDVAAFSRLAANGDIPEKLVEPAAKVMSAMRELQTAAGGGHLALDLIFGELPVAYQANWLKQAWSARAA